MRAQAGIHILPYAHYSNPDPEWARIAATLPPPEPPAESLTEIIARARKGSELWGPGNRAIYEPNLPNESEYQVKDHTISVDGGEIRVRVVIPAPQGDTNTFPLLVFFHGGGFWAGDIDMKDYLLRFLSTNLKIVTANVEYRLEPSPHPQDDSYTALKWAVTNSRSISADLSKGFVVMGSSAGGQITAVVAQRARDDPFFQANPLTGQILQVPTVCHPAHFPEQYKERLLSMDEDMDPRFLTKRSTLDVFSFLGGDPKDPSISPILAPSLAGLPRALVQVAGADPLRDEGILYSDLLREAGVESRLEIYPGVPHGFEDRANGTHAATKYIQDVQDALKWMTSAS